jgi:hypothetical protein
LFTRHVRQADEVRALRFGFSAGADCCRVQRGKELLLAYE